MASCSVTYDKLTGYVKMDRDGKLVFRNYLATNLRPATQSSFSNFIIGYHIKTYDAPSVSPTIVPSHQPTAKPTFKPTVKPTYIPTAKTTYIPTVQCCYCLAIFVNFK